MNALESSAFWRFSMKKTKLFLILMLLLTLVACGMPSATINTTETSGGTATLSNPEIHVTPAPDVETMVKEFMNAWQTEDYAAMYSLLAGNSQVAISEEDFTQQYLDTAAALTLQYGTGIDYMLVDTMTNPDSADVTVQVNYNTNLFATFTRDIELSLVREAGNWRLNWDESVIMPDLQGGNSLEIVRDIPSRGNIYANDDSPIAAQEDIVAIGFIPGDLDPDLMSLFYSTMSDLTIYQADEIIEMVDNALPYDYIPLGEVPQEEVDRRIGTLSALSGVYLNYYTSRFYFDGGIAPQAVGHLNYISEEDLYNYLRLGYAPNERFGSTGLEYAFEDELSGTRGASLYLKDANGQIITKVAERTAVAAQSITTTIDPKLQYLLQQSLGNYRGAIVVMEIKTGRVLAMVSNPQFDPNLFDINNENIIYADNPYYQEDDPVFNRATNGQYPLGSVFKIITMAAALDTGVFTESSEIYCGHSIEVCGNELYDWTYEKDKPPSGDLTLPEGLMRSCNPWFYYIGETLTFEGYPNAIADMARAFGLGTVTGVEIPEQPGNIPAQTDTCEINTQLAIGQGEMTVTPLQVAEFVAAIGNGGTLYRPALVDSIGVDGGTPTYTFEPEAVGTLPISDKDLGIIQEAMRSVISNGRGTAHIPLATMPYRAYGKTGTATNPFGESHAWFAGYTSVGNPEKPDIAVAVILENAGEGSEMAAPVFRRAVSLYFSNYVDYGYVLPWEADPYVVKSPTPIPTETPYGYEGPTEEP
jgi:cell division protein FtsI/penicillin-binding protein 2